MNNQIIQDEEVKKNQNKGINLRKLEQINEKNRLFTTHMPHFHNYIKSRQVWLVYVR